MSFLNAKRLNEHSYQLYCGLCGCRTDVVDQGYLDWLKKDFNQHYCFDCDIRSNEFPEFFDEIWEGVYAFWDAARCVGMGLRFSHLSGAVDEVCLLMDRDFLKFVGLAGVNREIEALNTACPVLHNSTSEGK